MKKMVMMQTLATAMLAMCLVGAGGCGKGDEATAETSALMPSNAIGVVHIDVAKTRDEITAAVEKDKETFGPFLAFLDPLKKIESADVYLIPGGREPKPLIALRGSIGPDDVIGILAKAEMKGSELIQAANGRYAIEGTPFLMIMGNEADDVPEGVVLAGTVKMMTPEFVAALGKEKNTAVEAMMAKIDTSAQIWGGVAMPEKEQTRGAPQQIYGSANITGPNPLNVSFLFADEDKAANTMKEFDKTPPFIKEVIALKQDGTTVTVTMIGEGNLIDNATKMIKGFMGAMMGPAMTPPSGPAPGSDDF